MGETSIITPVWYGVAAMVIIAPVVFYTIRFIANRVRDRKTREIIEESNREGPVPDIPDDVEIPEVVRRDRRDPLRKRFR